MKDKEKELVKRYPEAPLLVELAKTTWSGDIEAARVNFSLSDKLKTELKKQKPDRVPNADLSVPFGLTSETTPTSN